MPMEDSPLISIVIPTYNSEKTIGSLLESIKKQTYRNIEVIIIDGGSTDKTLEITMDFGAKIIRSHSNKPRARNIGILNTIGDYIFIADSDFVFEPNLIYEVVDCFKRNSCDAILIPEEYLNKGFLRKCRNLEKKVYLGVEAIEAPRVYKRWVFEKVLFDEKNEGPDEYDFYLNALKIGIHTCRVSSKIILLESPINFTKKIRHGKYFVYYRKKHQREEHVQKQISLSYRASLLFNAFKYSKKEALGLIIIKIFELASFALGMFVGLLDRKIQRLLISVEEEFEKIGKNYEVLMYQGSLGNEFIDNVEKEVILKILKERFENKRLKVLDVGAGTGRWSREFLKLGHVVTALDISEKMCTYLKEKFTSVIHGNIETININEKYDLIFSFRSFKYVIDSERALENISRMLREDGYIIIEVPNKHNVFYNIPNIIAPVVYAITKGKIGKYFILANLVSERDFRKSLEKHGFKVERIEKIFFFPHTLYSKINSKKYLKIIYFLDKNLSRFSPRSLIFVARKSKNDK